MDPQFPHPTTLTVLQRRHLPTPLQQANHKKVRGDTKAPFGSHK
jgi:hypothetical protein